MTAELAGTVSSREKKNQVVRSPKDALPSARYERGKPSVFTQKWKHSAATDVYR